MSKLVPILAQAGVLIAGADSDIGIVEAAAAAFFGQHPNGQAQAAVAEGIAKARAGISAATRAIDGAQSLTQADVDKAIADFVAAWADLQRTLESYGVLKSDGKFATPPGPTPTLERMPQPRLLAFRVRE